MTNNKLSKLAEGISSLSISKLSEKVEEKRALGEKIFNFTLGDFAPNVFPIPKQLETEITKAYQERHTNYPFVGGMKDLLESISQHIKLRGNFDYKTDEIVVTSGARPLIYLLFKTLVDPGEKVIYTAPSWNTQHFIYLGNASAITLRAKAENNFLITAQDIKPYIKEIVLINLNSPLNPSGTIFSKQQLQEILDLVVAENKLRINNQQKPIYIFFDVIYWLLIHNKTGHINPISLNPEVRDYVVFVDGISKCFAATGVRLGWAFGPKYIIQKMRSMLSHLGAWAAKPEQIATARYLKQHDQVTKFLLEFKKEILTRLNIFYTAIQDLKNIGYAVDAIEPQGAIYLSLKIDLIGKNTKQNKVIKDADDIMDYLLDNAKMAIVPFHYFGMDKSLPWFRLSVGTCSVDEAKYAAASLKKAIMELDN